MRELLARKLETLLADGIVIGVGTGTTVEFVLEEMAKKIRDESLQVSAITTSYQSARSCEKIGIRVLHPLSYSGRLAWGFDGADEIDSRCRVIKGKGGAMLKEKIVAARCNSFYIVADESKFVTELGRQTAVPVEVIPEALPLVEHSLLGLGATAVVLREGKPGKHGPVVTEAGNLILDVGFSQIGDDFEFRIKSLAGVVESGLFIGRTTMALIAGKDGLREISGAYPSSSKEIVFKPPSQFPESN